MVFVAAQQCMFSVDNDFERCGLNVRPSTNDASSIAIPFLEVVGLFNYFDFHGYEFVLG